MSSKFKVGDKVRITNPNRANFGGIEEVTKVLYVETNTKCVYGFKEIEKVEEEMKISMDKKYKTARGCEVVLFEVDEESSVVFGKRKSSLETYWIATSWDISGRAHGRWIKSPEDLVEVKEIKEETLYIHRSKIGNTHVDNNPDFFYSEEEVHRVVINESTLISE